MSDHSRVFSLKRTKSVHFSSGTNLFGTYYMNESLPIFDGNLYVHYGQDNIEMLHLAIFGVLENSFNSFE